MTIADPREAEAWLAAILETVQFEAFITDPSGVQRGKILRREELVGAFPTAGRCPARSCRSTSPAPMSRRPASSGTRAISNT